MSPCLDDMVIHHIKNNQRSLLMLRICLITRSSHELILAFYIGSYPCTGVAIYGNLIPLCY